MESSWKAGSDSLLLRPMIRKGKLVGLFGTLYKSYLVSVPVSSAACCFNPLIGFLDTLKTHTVLSNLSQQSAQFSQVHQLALQVWFGCTGVSRCPGCGVKSEMTWENA